MRPTLAERKTDQITTKKAKQITVKGPTQASFVIKLDLMSIWKILLQHQTAESFCTSSHGAEQQTFKKKRDHGCGKCGFNVVCVEIGQKREQCIAPHTRTHKKKTKKLNTLEEEYM